MNAERVISPPLEAGTIYRLKCGVYNENANESGTITVTLMGTSSSLPYVRSLALKRKEVSLMIVDANDSASVNVAEERCRVIKPPDITRAKEIGSESVSIFVPSLNYR